MSLDPPTRSPDVPGYRIVQLLGRGGFATVYEADQLSVDRRVALKVLIMSGLTPDDEKRFRAELRTVGSLSWHPHVVALHDAGITPAGLPFMAMELVPGGSWGDRVRSGGRCSPATVLTVGIQVARALAAAHAEGIVHRDVKPDNVLIGREGQALLADFGVATLVDGTHSVTAGFRGTLLYAAPELLLGARADARADLYSVGATLYTMAAGRAAFWSDGDETPLALINRVQTQQAPPLPPDVPKPLVSVIGRAMAADPDHRPSSAAALEAELRAALDAVGGKGGRAVPSGGTPAPQSGPSPTVSIGGPPTAIHPSPPTPAPAVPKPTPVPVHLPAPQPAPPLPPPPGDRHRPPPKPFPLWAPGVRPAMWYSILSGLLCCAPVGLLFAIQAHRRLIAAGGRLRRRYSKGRSMVAFAYLWTLISAAVTLGYPASVYLDARADTGRFAGQWEGTSGALTLNVTLEQASAGLELDGTFTTSGDTKCSGRYTDSNLNGDTATLTAEGTCDPPIPLPDKVQASLSEDGETLTVAGIGGGEIDLRNTG